MLESLIHDIKLAFLKFTFFSKQEKAGILVLCFFSILGIFTPRFLTQYYSSTYNSKNEKDIIAHLQAIKDDRAISRFNSAAFSNNLNITDFDPNTVTEEELIQMGLPSWLAARFIKFRNVIGGYKNEADIKKIYGLHENTFSAIQPHLKWENTQSNNSAYLNNNKFFYSNENSKKVTPKITNIQDIDYTMLVSIGFEPKTANVFLKYRNSGAHFYNEMDLKKVYGIDEKQLKKALPYLVFEQKKENKIEDKNVNSNVKNIGSANVYSKKVCSIEINTADAETWKCLNGIGEKLSARIVKYRSALGGFYSVMQIAEVWGLQDSVFQNIRQQLLLNEKSILKININTCTEADLDFHPYINKKQAENIIQYRIKNEKIDDIQSLKSAGILDENTFNKVKPYLSIR